MSARLLGRRSTLGTTSGNKCTTRMLRKYTPTTRVLSRHRSAKTSLMRSSNPTITSISSMPNPSAVDLYMPSNRTLRPVQSRVPALRGPESEKPPVPPRELGMQLQELDAAMMILISLKELMCDRPASLILAGHLRKRRWGRGRAVRCRPEDMREAWAEECGGRCCPPS